MLETITILYLITKDPEHKFQFGLLFYTYEECSQALDDLEPGQDAVCVEYDKIER